MTNPFSIDFRLLRCRKVTVKRLALVFVLVFCWLLVTHSFGPETSSKAARAQRARSKSLAADGKLPEKYLLAEDTGNNWEGNGDGANSNGKVDVLARRGSNEDQRKIVQPLFNKPGEAGPMKDGGRSAQGGADQAGNMRAPFNVKLFAGQVVATAAAAAEAQKWASRDSEPAEAGKQGMSNVAPAPVRVDPMALVILRPEQSLSISLSDLRELMAKHRIRYELGFGGARQTTFFPQSLIAPGGLGRYSVVVFEDWSLYTEAGEARRKELDAYCLRYGVGVAAFVSPSHPFVLPKVTVRPLVQDTTANVTMSLTLNGRSPMLRIVRDGGAMPAPATAEWCAFEGATGVFDPVEYATAVPPPPREGVDLGAGRAAEEVGAGPAAPRKAHLVSLLDAGSGVDGVRRVLFCRPGALHHWLHKALFLDALSYLSPVSLGLPLARRFLVDIDDIFVAPLGTKMSSKDVEELVATQEEVRGLVPGFTFNLGFVGSRFKFGTDWEAEGDQKFASMAEHFYWFPHTYTHIAPHRLWNVSETIRQMKDNRQFAKNHSIPVSGQYAISPKHSGVYPVHEPLYTAWREVWGVRATSTEEYMHLRPGYKRRGFIYRGVKVVPRQTCGLFTHTFKRDEYPGGIQRLDELVQGGDMFESILHNSICIFMTHVSNYGHDRLGNYVVKSVVKYVQRWTNLNLSYVPPHVAASEYFEMYLDETMPFWLDPCRDPRHYAIWSEEHRRCFNLPNILIVGPQKTGTTALLDFMTRHPKISRNSNTPAHYEEMQFFSNDANYLFGLDWYMKHMPMVHKDWNQTITYNASIEIEKPTHFIVEKSATYFDSYMSPLRAWRLLPSVKVIVILIDPVKRAYSWWQHQVAHKDPITNQVMFRGLLARNHHHNKARAALKNRCLFPGLYATHLKRWLAFFAPNQIHIVDGDKLVNDPVTVLHAVQRFLGVQFVDYSKLIRRSPTKGFFCPVVNGKMRCLGKGKGRVYPPMDVASRFLLRQYFSEHNKQLAKLLHSLKTPLPTWLKEDLARRADLNVRLRT